MRLKNPQHRIFYAIDSNLVDRAYQGNRLAIVVLAREAASLLQQIFVLPDEMLEALLEALLKLDERGLDPDRAFGWTRNMKGRPSRNEPNEATRRLTLAKTAREMCQAILPVATDDLEPLVWLVSVLEQIACGKAPNSALNWERCSAGHPPNESPFWTTIVREEVAWLMRHGLSKASACMLIGDGFDGLPSSAREFIRGSDELMKYLNSPGHQAPLSSKRIEEICSDLDPWVDQERDYFPL